MKAIRNKLRGEERGKDEVVRQAVPPCPVTTEDGMDISLIEDSLAKTPWERMQANDDALRFAGSLREAMEKRNAKP